MTAEEFIESYYLHDSLITNVAFYDADCSLDITVELCFWAQNDYIEGNPEVGAVHLLFSDVSRFESDGLDGKIDFYSIVDACADGDSVTLNILDDFNNADYELKIIARDVQVVL